ncbi:MAG: B12-binding domain-containing radical SAM protein [Phycisphaerae bacterium]|nr:B12-binding domain-containing radical SAM protein [Phycisphaerae bacterium]
MNVALICTHTRPIALGLRYVSAHLKACGHDVRVIFMAAKRDTSKADFGKALIDDVIDHVRDRDLIGMSLMTNTFHRAAALTESLRDAGIKTPILWGGTHPTLAPRECLDVADVVCVGEGEHAAASLCRRMEAGRDPTDLPGLCFRGGGLFGNRQTVENEVGPLERDLDSLAFPDYDLESHWVAHRDGLAPATQENLRPVLERVRILTTRGCPNHCTFCNNTVWRRTYRGKGPWVRMRSVDSVLSEIRRLRERFACIQAINIVDDLFLVRGEQQLAEFVSRYAAEVNLPLELDAFPGTVTEDKVRTLARIPLRLVSLGIESASPDTLQRIYNRPTSIESIAESIELFHRYGIPAEYHYLVSNPYEPPENMIETMRFIASHHRGPARCRVFPVMLYPGTPLHERARADGLLAEKEDQAYRYTLTGNLKLAGYDYWGIWLRAVLYLRNRGASSGVAHRVVNFVAHPLVRRCLDRRWFAPVVFGVYQGGRKVWRNLIYQPFVRPVAALYRAVSRGPRAATHDHRAYGSPA